MEHWLVWLIVAVVMAIVELLTPTFFVIWFSASAIVTSILSLFIKDLLTQSFIFTIISFILIIFTKQLTQRFLKNSVKTAVDTLVGKTGVVIDTIKSAYDPGRIKVDGQLWKAEPLDGNNIEKGEIVKVLVVDGVTLKVEKIKGGN